MALNLGKDNKSIYGRIRNVESDNSLLGRLTNEGRSKFIYLLGFVFIIFVAVILKVKKVNKHIICL